MLYSFLSIGLTLIAPQFAIQHFAQFLEASVTGLAARLATGSIEAAGMA
jgi:hypothetical protein